MQEPWNVLGKLWTEKSIYQHVHSPSHMAPFGLTKDTLLGQRIQLTQWHFLNFSSTFLIFAITKYKLKIYLVNTFLYKELTLTTTTKKLSLLLETYKTQA